MGDRLTDIFISMQSQLRALALRLTGNRNDADDALQEAFCRLWARRNSIADDTAGGYVARAVGNAAIDAARRKAPVPLDQLSESDWDDSLSGGYEENLGEDPGAVLDRLATLVDKLPGMQGRVMRLHDLEGLDNDEIGAYLSLSPEAVRTNLSRARMRIRKEYETMKKRNLL